MKSKKWFLDRIGKYVLYKMPCLRKSESIRISSIKHSNDLYILNKLKIAIFKEHYDYTKKYLNRKEY